MVSSLNYLDPPTILDRPETIIANQSVDVTMNCSTVGKPKPTISWYMNDKLVVNDETPRKIQKYLFNKTSGALTITNVKPLDSGTYLCMAENLDKYPGANLTVSLIGMSCVFIVGT
jgi:E3 CR1-alpha-1-like protein